MKKLGICLLIACLAGACNAKPQESVAPAVSAENTVSHPTGNKTPHILVAYFSRADENYSVGNIRTGNTQKVAEEIARQTGGTLFHIQPVKSYPAAYKPCTEVAKQEQDAQARPTLTQKVPDMDQYDVIYLGYPIWWGDVPMAVYTFLESYDFSNKIIRPFATHEGSGLGRIPTTLPKALPHSKVSPGLALYGHVAQNEPDRVRTAVSQWIAQ